MHQSKLIRLLRTLSAGQWRSFMLFMASPYVNQNERLHNLAAYLHSCAPGFEESLLEKNLLFERLFETDTPFSSQALHDLFAQLLRLLYKFWAYEELEKDPDTLARYQLRALAGSGQNELFLKRYAAQSENLQAEAGRDPERLLQLYLLQLNFDKFMREHRRQESGAHLQAWLLNLDAYYLTAKLQGACEAVNNSKIFNAPLRVQFMDQPGKWLDEMGGAFEHFPLIGVYHHIYRMLTAGSETEADACYQQVNDMLLRKADAIRPEEQARAYAFLQNHCVRQINAGRTSYMRELFSLYQYLLKQNLLSDGEYLPHESVKNIATLGLRLKEFDWVYEFLNEVKTRLDPVHRENAVTYNLAVYHYERQSYREALRLLNRVEFTDVFYQLGARSLQLKIFYELEEDDSLLYFAKSFRSYLKRNREVSALQYTQYDNLLKYTQRAYQLKIRRGAIPETSFAAQAAALHSELENGIQVINLNWLREKVLELTGSAR